MIVPYIYIFLPYINWGPHPAVSPGRTRSLKICATPSRRSWTRNPTPSPRCVFDEKTMGVSGKSPWFYALNMTRWWHDQQLGIDGDMGLSENGVYSQWNSHLVGIMISKTIGSLGTRHFQTNPNMTRTVDLLMIFIALQWDFMVKIWRYDGDLRGISRGVIGLYWLRDITTSKTINFRKSSQNSDT